MPAEVAVRGVWDTRAALEALAGDLAGLSPLDAAEVLVETTREIARPHRRTGRYLASVRRGQPLGTTQTVEATAPYAKPFELHAHPINTATRIAAGDIRDATEQQIADTIRSRRLS